MQHLPKTPWAFPVVAHIILDACQLSAIMYNIMCGVGQLYFKGAAFHYARIGKMRYLCPPLHSLQRKEKQNHKV